MARAVEEVQIQVCRRRCCPEARNLEPQDEPGNALGLLEGMEENERLRGIVEPHGGANEKNGSRKEFLAKFKK